MCQPFGGFVNIAAHFRGEISPKPQFLGREQAFSSQTCKILKVSCYRNYLLIFTKFGIKMETRKWSLWLIAIGAQQIQDNGRPPFRKSQKSQKSRYLRNGQIDLYKIWYGGAKWVS